jgi:hypothetical protein
MNTSIRAIAGNLFGAVFVFTGIATWWVGGNVIRAGTLTGGATLVVIGLLFVFAGLLALPVSRRRLQDRFDIDLSTSTTVLLSGSSVVLAVFLLVAALIALLASW